MRQRVVRRVRAISAWVFRHQDHRPARLSRITVYRAHPSSPGSSACVIVIVRVIGRGMTDQSFASCYNALPTHHLPPSWRSTIDHEISPSLASVRVLFASALHARVCAASQRVRRKRDRRCIQRQIARVQPRRSSLAVQALFCLPRAG